MFARPPRDPRLRGIAKTFWASQGGSGRGAPSYERVLPTGCAHLVFRLEGPALTTWGPAGPERVGHEIVGGPRSEPYVRLLSEGVSTVGVQFEAGAAPCVLGVPADVIAGRHVPLGDLWGREARRWREILSEQPTLDGRLDRFEQLLASRLVAARGRLGAWAIQRMFAGDRIGEVVEASGYSHRHFVKLFRGDVGLAPKAFERVVRFQRVVAALAGERTGSIAEVAQAAGYADQAHLTREFRALAGVPPGRYLRTPGPHPNHVPWVNFLQDLRRSGVHL